MENQCEVPNRSSCRGSVNYIIFSRRHSAQTCQVPASGGCLSSCWGKSLSPGSRLTAKGQAIPGKQLVQANSLRQIPSNTLPSVTIEIGGARSWREAARVSGRRLVSVHSVNLREKQVHPIWVGQHCGGLRGRERGDQRP